MVVLQSSVLPDVAAQSPHQSSRQTQHRLPEANQVTAACQPVLPASAGDHQGGGGGGGGGGVYHEAVR